MIDWFMNTTKEINNSIPTDYGKKEAKKTIKEIFNKETKIIEREEE